ncbi:MAG: DUF2807 domain-containing protein, partial [Saonia sp.]
ITTHIKDETLVLEKTKRMKGKDTVKVFISLKQLDALQVGSKASAETMGAITGAHLELQFNDDSIGKLELSYTSVTCKAASGASVKIKGNSAEIDFSNKQ